MEAKTRILDPEALMEQLPGMLEQVQAVPLVISGNSMSPFLVHRRDTVYLSKVTAPLKKGDMILYCRDNGAYILHRICKVDADGYTLIGDAQPVKEPGIRPDQVLAVVTAVRRKGKLLQPGSFRWEFFARVWLRMIPLRRSCIGMYELIFGKKTEKME